MRRFIPVIVVLVVILGVIGAALSYVGGSDEGDKSTVSESAQSTVAAGSTGGARGGATTSGSSPAMPATGAAAPSSASSAGGGGSANAALQGNLGPMVIRTAEMHISVEDVAGGLDQVRRIVIDEGGSIFSSSTSTENETQVSTLTLQVPSDRFDQVIDALRQMPGVGKVEREQVSSQDVTEEYLDLDSRLRNLNATESRYLALLGNASRMEDILALERELTRVRGDIEQITGRIRYLENRTQFSRITVTLRPISAAASTDASGFDLVKIIQEAWANSLEFTGTVLSGLITVVVFFWWLWPLGIVAALIATRIRGRRPPVDTTTAG